MVIFLFRFSSPFVFSPSHVRGEKKRDAASLHFFFALLLSARFPPSSVSPLSPLSPPGGNIVWVEGLPTSQRGGVLPTSQRGEGPVGGGGECCRAIRVVESLRESQTRAQYHIGRRDERSGDGETAVISCCGNVTTRSVALASEVL